MYKLFRVSWLWLILFIIFIGLLIFLSSLPLNMAHTTSFILVDKIIHFVYFMGLSGLLNFYWASEHRTSYLPYGWLSILIIASIGAFDEWLQSYTPGRSGNDLGDLIADCIGAVVGYLIVRLIYRYTYK